MTHASSGVSIWLIYNDNNLRVQQVGWINPSVQGGRIWVWENGSLVHESLLPATESGSENVPGNYRLRELIDPEFGNTYFALPAGITYRFQWPG